jgi:hypothetical protein
VGQVTEHTLQLTCTRIPHFHTLRMRCDERVEYIVIQNTQSCLVIS